MELASAHPNQCIRNGAYPLTGIAILDFGLYAKNIVLLLVEILTGVFPQ